jgi:hypothetical protein
MLDIRRDIIASFRDIGIALQPEDITHRTSNILDKAKPHVVITVGNKTAPLASFRFTNEEIEAYRDSTTPENLKGRIKAFSCVRTETGMPLSVARA